MSRVGPWSSTNSDGVMVLMKALVDPEKTKETLAEFARQATILDERHAAIEAAKTAFELEKTAQIQELDGRRAELNARDVELRKRANALDSIDKQQAARQIDMDRARADLRVSMAQHNNNEDTLNARVAAVSVREKLVLEAEKKNKDTADQLNGRARLQETREATFAQAVADHETRVKALRDLIGGQS